MHEMGIVLHLAKSLDMTVKQNNIKKIAKVTLQVGEVSGIMTNLFEDCFNYFKKDYDYLRDAKLEIEPLRAVTHCTNCNKDYLTIKYGVTCPYCDSTETYLLKGNECIIKEIEAE